MITRKHLFFAIAATCLLTTFLFGVAPIRSQTAGQYDPWLDANGDGKIDGKDIALPALIYGTAGDPTRDVNVTNFPLDGQGNLKTTDYLPSGTFNTSCIISVQTTSVVGSGNPYYGGPTAQGIPVTIQYPATFFFIFNPLASDFNVSRIVLQSISYSTAIQNAPILLNGISVCTLEFNYPNQALVNSAPITRVQTLQPGINNLTIQPLVNAILVQDLSLFVEYQYTQ